MSEPHDGRNLGSDVPIISGDAMLIGIGNDGRQDDGLGWAFLDAVKGNGSFTGSLNYRFQLQIEDADAIRQASQVIFVDAFRGPLLNGFSWECCLPTPNFDYTSHQLHPSTVLHLCRQLYGVYPAANLLLISGSQWELEFGLSKEATSNLESALGHFDSLIEINRVTSAALETVHPTDKLKWFADRS